MAVGAVFLGRDIDGDRHHSALTHVISCAITEAGAISMLPLPAGWSCALGVAWVFFGAPIVQMAATSFGIDIPLPELPTDYLFELLLGLLGMAGIRGFDKLKGNSG
jgi:hypothetical protein